MDKIRYFKEQLINYCERENIDLIEEIMKLFELSSLEEVYIELRKINTRGQFNDFLEGLCEDLIINSVAKIERSGMKLGLHRMYAILKLFGNPERNLRVIHIAGTNGKGSVSSYLQTTLKKKYKVGMYSSPGMISFNDRIRINDTFISYVEMYETYNNVVKIWEKNFPETKDNLSFFEILTVVALIYFEKNNVDFVIMEVGLGGRYDGTNIFCEKELSIITKIGLDHTDLLGDTLEKITMEKAGIIQKYDNVLAYPGSREVITTLEDVAKQQGANLTILDTNSINVIETAKNFTVFCFGDYSSIRLKMLGEHQVYNAALAIMALENLVQRNVVTLTQAEIISGIENTVWAGRLEWLTDNILIDGAHNIDGVTSLVHYIQENKMQKLKVLLGILTDKDYKEMIELFETLDAQFNVTKVPIEIKKSSVADLKNSFRQEVITYENYEQAVTEILKTLKKDETLIITGSLYLIAAVRKYVLENIK